MISSKYCSCWLEAGKSAIGRADNAYDAAGMWKTGTKANFMKVTISTKPSLREKQVTPSWRAANCDHWSLLEIEVVGTTEEKYKRGGWGPAPQVKHNICLSFFFTFLFFFFLFSFFVFLLSSLSAVLSLDI